jgi:hypothetical protein
VHPLIPSSFARISVCHCIPPRIPVADRENLCRYLYSLMVARAPFIFGSLFHPKQFSSHKACGLRTKLWLSKKGCGLVVQIKKKKLECIRPVRCERLQLRSNNEEKTQLLNLDTTLYTLYTDRFGCNLGQKPQRTFGWKTQLLKKYYELPVLNQWRWWQQILLLYNTTPYCDNIIVSFWLLVPSVWVSEG